jgi:hypothetical protein
MDARTLDASGSIEEHFTTMCNEIEMALQKVIEAIDNIK